MPRHTFKFGGQALLFDRMNIINKTALIASFILYSLTYPGLSYTQSTPTPTAQTKRINYQPAGSTPVPDFDTDSGEPFDPVRGYGWRIPTPTITSTPTISPTPVLTLTPTPTSTPMPYSYSNDELFSIPDNDAGCVISTLFIPDDITIGGINIYVDIEHPYIADLTVDVVSPSSTIVRLHDQTGGGRADMQGWYEKEVAADGPGSTDDFIGETSYGEWALLVIDRSSLHAGSIRRWEIEINGSMQASPTPSPTPTTTPLPGYYSSSAIGAVKGNESAMSLYGYSTLIPGDYSYYDIIARNPSPLSEDSWVMPAGNNVKSIADIDIDGDGIKEVAVIKEPASGDYDLYIYAAPYAGDDTEEEALARNPSPLARDFWFIPSGNVVALSAIHDLDGDGWGEIAVLKDDGGETPDQNLYIYNAPAPGDWTYWDAAGRNPSPLARDLWAIPAADNTITLACASVDADPEEDAIVTVKDEGGGHNLYIWDLPAPGDWTYWDALARNPSPLARDFWSIPSGNEVVTASGINSYGERLAVLKQSGTDQNLYIYSVPSPGDWVYWDAAARNPSPLARDLWMLPLDNDTVAITGMNVMAQDYSLGVGISRPENGALTSLESIDVLGWLNKEASVELFVNSESRGEQYVTQSLSKSWASEDDWAGGAGVHVDTESAPGSVRIEAIAGGFYYAEGTITLDLDAGGTSSFTGIDIDAELSNGNYIGCRYRIADSYNELLAAGWSSINWDLRFPVTEDNAGRWIRLEFTLKTDDISSTPELRSAVLHYINTSPTFLFEDVAISEGINQLEVAATRCEETANSSISVECDLAPPTVAIGYPQPGETIIPSAITVTGTVTDSQSVAVNGAAGVIEGTDYSVYGVQLAAGPNTLTATARDAAGNQVTDMVTIEYNDDLDEDGLTNDEELDLGTDPEDADTDGDGLPDGWEVAHGLDPNSIVGDDGAGGDPDGDGKSNFDEYTDGTDPSDPDMEAPSIAITSPAQGAQIR